MSDSLRDVLLTDAELDRIALRELEAHEDFVLAGLSALALAVDQTPLPAAELPLLATPMSGARKGGLALAATVALVLSSSGVAAAVTDDPMAPLHYVAKHVWSMAPHGRGQLPGWDSDGSEPVSAVPQQVAPRLADGRAAGSAGLVANPNGGLGPDAQSSPPEGRLDVQLSSRDGSHGTSGGQGGSGQGRQGLTSPPRPPRQLPGQSGHHTGTSDPGFPRLPRQPNSPGGLDHTSGGEGSTTGGAHVGRAPTSTSPCHGGSGPAPATEKATTCVHPTPPVAQPTTPPTSPTPQPAAGQSAAGSSATGSPSRAPAPAQHRSRGDGHSSRPHHRSPEPAAGA